MTDDTKKILNGSVNVLNDNFLYTVAAYAASFPDENEYDRYTPTFTTTTVTTPLQQKEEDDEYTDGDLLADLTKRVLNKKLSREAETILLILSQIILDREKENEE